MAGYPELDMRRHTDAIVVHSADTPSLLDVGVEEIRKWHMDKGWNDVGYHYVIRRNGVVEEGRDKDAVGAHVRGYNQVTLGICLVGGWKGKFDFTKAQMAALEALIGSLLLVYKHATVRGHRDYNKNKDCPGFDVETWWFNGTYQGT